MGSGSRSWRLFILAGLGMVQVRWVEARPCPGCRSWGSGHWFLWIRSRELPGSAGSHQT